jgi:hypothetical protein
LENPLLTGGNPLSIWPFGTSLPYKLFYMGSYPLFAGPLLENSFYGYEPPLLSRFYVVGGKPLFY